MLSPETEVAPVSTNFGIDSERSPGPQTSVKRHTSEWKRQLGKLVTFWRS